MSCIGIWLNKSFLPCTCTIFVFIRTIWLQSCIISPFLGYQISWNLPKRKSLLYRACNSFNISFIVQYSFDSYVSEHKKMRNRWISFRWGLTNQFVFFLFCHTYCQIAILEVICRTLQYESIQGQSHNSPRGLHVMILSF